MGKVRDILIGDYDYKFLCTPQWPFCGGGKLRKPSIFFGKDDVLSVLVALIMGLQHALAMVGGLITPPLLIGAMSGNQDTQRYMINAALIWAGVATFIQVKQFRIPGINMVIGTGVLSVTGISFTFYTPVQAFVSTYMATCVLADGSNKSRCFEEAYGKCLGTILVGGILVFLFSFLPARTIRRIFPPLVNGIAILLIGLALVKAGVKYWGGGAFCHDNLTNYGKPIANCSVVSGNATLTTTCYKPPFSILCSDAGDVKLPFGHPVYLGLGFSVFACMIMFELFGSPFMRNTAVALSLVIGFVISAAATYEGKKFVTSAKIDAAPIFAFLWIKTFPIGFAAPLLLPVIICAMCLVVEVVGDVTATRAASRLETTGEEHDDSIAGGLRADGISVFLGALATSMPVTCFAQNNGVIQLTSCGSRTAGFATAFWLIFMGIFAKLAALITSIPQPVLGGMTTFLFANVGCVGIKILTQSKITRRSLFILTMALGLGFAVELVPHFVDVNLWPATADMSESLKGLNDSVQIIVTHGFMLGTITAMALNLLLPFDDDEERAVAMGKTYDDETDISVAPKQVVV